MTKKNTPRAPRPSERRSAHRIAQVARDRANVVGLREPQNTDRLTALNLVVQKLDPFNKQERTNLLAAVAEFYGLSLRVEN